MFSHILVKRSKSESTVTDVTLEFTARSSEWKSRIFSEDTESLESHGLMISYYKMKYEEGILCQENTPIQKSTIVRGKENLDNDEEFLKEEKLNTVAAKALDNILVETEMEHCGNNDETKEVCNDQLTGGMEIAVEETVSQKNDEGNKDVEETDGDSEEK